MDTKALYNLSYGVFLLGTKSGGKINACITNTCFQAANSPTRIALSVIKGNLTCQMIQESGLISLSILDTSCSFETIKHFGYQSGRSADKFADFEHEIAENGCPYIKKEACALILGKVTNQLDLGTHMLFVCEVTDAQTFAQNGKSEPLTYAYYQGNIKAKSAAAENGALSSASSSAGDASSDAEPKKIKGWRCKICGYEYDGSELPEDYECPLCGHPAEDFEPIYD